MTEKEKMLMYEKYMRDRNFSQEKIKFNLSVVECLSSQVLSIFGQGLENIDTYSFEEFTDMVALIDDRFGGREGIPKMLETMMDLTECLKLNKLIKGGKIAHYKRMFSDLEYYLDKYDMMTGRKDDTKEYIKTVTSNRFSSSVIKIADDINVYEFETLVKIEKILNDVPFEHKELNDEIRLIKHILMDLRLFDEKNGQMETTKKGRALSRLAAEDRYGALVYLLLYNVNWNSVLSQYNNSDTEIDFKSVLKILASIFSRNKEIVLNVESMKEVPEEEILLEIATERFRIAKVESMLFGYTILDICFVGMGLMEIEKGGKGEIIYRATALGQQIFKLIYSEDAWNMRNSVDIIRSMIKNRKYDKAEVEILEFLSTYGGNIVIWDYFGQLLLLKKNYKYAYVVLKNAYENSSKRGRTAKSVLYHLVLCCRKLKLKDDIENYEGMLQVMEKA